MFWNRCAYMRTCITENRNNALVSNSTITKHHRRCLEHNENNKIKVDCLPASFGDSGDRGGGGGGGGVESLYAFFVPSGTSDYVKVVGTSSVKQPVYSASVYSATCCFNSCAEQGHKASVQTLFLLSPALVSNDRDKGTQPRKTLKLEQFESKRSCCRSFICGHCKR